MLENNEKLAQEEAGNIRKLAISVTLALGAIASIATVVGALDEAPVEQPPAVIVPINRP